MIPGEWTGKGRECSGHIRGTVVKSEAGEVDTLVHAGPFSQLIHCYLCPQTIKYMMK